MTNWQITYGMCDGTGPYKAEIETNDIISAIQKLASFPAIKTSNIISVVRVEDARKDRVSLEALEGIRFIIEGIAKDFNQRNKDLAGKKGKMVHDDILMDMLQIIDKAAEIQEAVFREIDELFEGDEVKPVDHGFTPGTEPAQKPKL